MPRKKVAMVQPVARTPRSSPVTTGRQALLTGPPPGRTADLPLFADPTLEAKLIKALQTLKNNRAFTVLEYHSLWASVHFEGDSEPTTVIYKE